MCIVMETNELTSIDDKLVDTSTIQTTSSIHSLLNIENRVGGGCTEGRIGLPAGLLSQGALPLHRLGPTVTHNTSDATVSLTDYIVYRGYQFIRFPYLLVRER